MQALALDVGRAVPEVHAEEMTFMPAASQLAGQFVQRLLAAPLIHG